MGNHVSVDGHVLSDHEPIEKLDDEDESIGGVRFVHCKKGQKGLLTDRLLAVQSRPRSKLFSELDCRRLNTLKRPLVQVARFGL